MSRDPDGRESGLKTTHRRTVLKGLGALSVVGLAGCGGDGGATDTPTDTDGGSTPTETTSEPTTTGPDTTAPGTTTTTTAPDVPPGEQPPSVTPGGIDIGAEPPSDAEILFGEGVDGLEKWESGGGGDPGWTVAEDGSYFRIDVGSGDIQTREAFGDCHLHVEFSPPDDSSDSGQAKGNSGVFMEGRYEFQVLNNWENETYGQGMAGSYYAQSPPLVDPARPSEEWQAYDIIWRGPRFEDGEVVHPAKAVQFFNGVVTQVHLNVGGPTTASLNPYQPHDRGGPLGLQDHGDSANRYRNVWYRPLPEPRRDAALRTDYDENYQQPEYFPWPEEYQGVTSEARGDAPVAAVDPGQWPDDPPADATVLLSGGDLSGWEGPDGGDPGWTEADGYVAVEPGAGNVRTAEALGDGQLHAEFRIPEGSAGAGNSGLLLANRYGFRIRDNHEAVSQPERWVGAYTGQAAPLASPTRPPGEWQTLDVVWEGPRFEREGRSLVRPARATVLLNGVVVQKRLVLDGQNVGESIEYDPDRAHPPEAPLGLQENGEKVHFRNVWHRSFF
jgi:hypothetical protein